MLFLLLAPIFGISNKEIIQVENNFQTFSKNKGKGATATIHPPFPTEINDF